MTSSQIDDSEFRALRELSAALGADPLRTQGAGGNTSIKRDGVMWIKASGTWLVDALAQDIFTPVRLDPLRRAIADGDPRAAAAVDFVDTQRNAGGLRPSIETSVHAIIPAPVVVHIHCVNTIALAVRHDGEALARERLRPHADLALAFVPYRKPGLPLAHAIAERLSKGTNVLVLANHGLVVAGETVAEVADRIERVCETLSVPARVAPQVDAEKLAAIVGGSDYRLPARPRHACCRARSERPCDRATRLALPRPRGLPRAGSRGSLRRRRPPSRAARRSPPAPDDAVARSRCRSPSLDIEERGSDGAVSCGCCGPHFRRSADTRADRRRRSGTHELGSGSLPAVGRKIRAWA